MGALRPVLLTLALTAAAIAGAVPAAAIPQCTNTGPTTTQCERPGNAQIATSPGVTSANNFPYGYPWNSGGITIDLGGIFGVG